MRLALPSLVVLLFMAPAARADEALDWAEKAYRVHASVEPAPLKQGDKARLRIAIEPVLPDAKVHPEAPIKVKLAAPEALRLPKDKLTRADGRPAGKGYAFEVTVEAAQAGSGDVQANVDFFICSERWCVKQHARVTAPVKVCSAKQAHC